MISTELEVLQRELRKFYKQNLQERTKSLRQLLLDDSKHLDWKYDFTSIRIPSRRLVDLIGLAVMSWYMNEEIRFLVQQELISNWPTEEKEVGEILLTSEIYMLAWLKIQQKFTERDFFGNVLNRRLSNIWSLSTFRKISERQVKKYTGWCRGHQESNHLRISPLPAELRVGTISLKEEQSKTEESYRKLQNLVRQIEDFLDSR